MESTEDGANFLSFYCAASPVRDRIGWFALILFLCTYRKWRDDGILQAYELHTVARACAEKTQNQHSALTTKSISLYTICSVTCSYSAHCVLCLFAAHQMDGTCANLLMMTNSRYNNATIDNSYIKYAYYHVPAATQACTLHRHTDTYTSTNDTDKASNLHNCKSNRASAHLMI